MRKIILPILSLLAIACSKEIDESTFMERMGNAEDYDSSEKTAKANPTTEPGSHFPGTETESNNPGFEPRSFAIDEHSAAGSTIGFLAVADADENPITYTLTSGNGIDIDQNTGELKVGARLKLDFEHKRQRTFTVSAFNGKNIAQETFILNIQDIDERVHLTGDQKELIAHFQYLTLWKGPHVRAVNTNRKWKNPIKLHLGGFVTDAYRANVQRALSEYNALFTKGDFSITLTENAEEANGKLFFGPKEEVANVWPDMYKKIKGGNYSGYAMTPSQNSVFQSTRIWISNPIISLFKHELGHALGLGHSNHCGTENSIMCSVVGTESEISPIDANIFRYLYHKEFPAGLSEAAIEKVLANLIVNER